MNRVNVHSLGFAFGSFLGAFHLLWAVMVGIGVAQRAIDFIFLLHMIDPPWFHIAPFAWSNAIGLVAFTAAIGYGVGVFFGFVWNRFMVVSRPTVEQRRAA